MTNAKELLFSVLSNSPSKVPGKETARQNNAVVDLENFRHTRASNEVAATAAAGALASTSLRGGGARGEKLLAIDCEMCYTEKGPELTRVSVVDDCCNVVYDQLVKPSSPILDYVTQFSGITAEMMENVTTTLAQVQEKMLHLIDNSEASETYLVGHSLENDLYSLKLFHPHVIDTAIMYPHSKGAPFKFSLKNLAERYLGKNIQASVHDSIEDAKTAMELARLKLRNGPQFGEFEVDGVSVCKILTDHKRYSSLLDRPDVLIKHAVGTANAIRCNSDEEAGTKATKEVKSQTANLIWTQFEDVYAQLESEVSARLCVEDLVEELEKEREEEEEEEEGKKAKAPLSSRLAEIQESFEASAEVQAKLRKMDERIGEIHASLPSNTMMIVLSGQGNTAYIRHLQQLKWRCKNMSGSSKTQPLGKDKNAEENQTKVSTKSGGTSLWDEKCDHHLNYSMRQAAETMCFITIKE